MVYPIHGGGFDDVEVAVIDSVSRLQKSSTQRHRWVVEAVRVLGQQSKLGFTGFAWNLLHDSQAFGQDQVGQAFGSERLIAANEKFWQVAAIAFQMDLQAGAGPPAPPPPLVMIAQHSHRAQETQGKKIDDADQGNLVALEIVLNHVDVALA